MENHILGHSLEYFQADTARRFYDLKGHDTKILSGEEENALKNIQAAEKEFQFKNFLIVVHKFLKPPPSAHLAVFQKSSDQEKH